MLMYQTRLMSCGGKGVAKFSAQNMTCTVDDSVEWYCTWSYYLWNELAVIDIIAIGEYLEPHFPL